jgi:hypothetical protein
MDYTCGAEMSKEDQERKEFADEIASFEKKLRLKVPGLSRLEVATAMAYAYWSINKLDALDALRYRAIRATTKAIRDDDGCDRTAVTPAQFDAAADDLIAKGIV